MVNPHSSLPPGFRFHPTDEELIHHYLKKKLNSIPCPVSIIADVDIYKFNPWELPAQASFGDKEWFFFSPRDRKYPNGARPNRAAASGYWKATGTDKVIEASSPEQSRLRRTPDSIGVKKALVFYQGKPPKGVKTNWIMHEYRLADTSGLRTQTQTSMAGSKSKDSSMRLDDWVLCRIYKKSNPSLSPSPAPTLSSDQDQEEEEEQLVSFTNLLDPMDSFLNSLLADNLDPFEFDASSQTISGIDQSFFSNNDNNLPGFGTAPATITENRLKRELTNAVDDALLHPSKKFINSCSYDKSGQSNLLSQQFYMTSHLQFPG